MYLRHLTSNIDVPNGFDIVVEPALKEILRELRNIASSHGWSRNLAGLKRFFLR